MKVLCGILGVDFLGLSVWKYATFTLFYVTFSHNAEFILNPVENSG
jgi:hypothetical protein